MLGKTWKNYCDEIRKIILYCVRENFLFFRMTIFHQNDINFDDRKYTSISVDERKSLDPNLGFCDFSTNCSLTELLFCLSGLMPHSVVYYGLPDSSWVFHDCPSHMIHTYNTFM